MNSGIWGHFGGGDPKHRRGRYSNSYSTQHTAHSGKQQMTLMNDLFELTVMLRHNRGVRRDARKD